MINHMNISMCVCLVHVYGDGGRIRGWIDWDKPPGSRSFLGVLWVCLCEFLALGHFDLLVFGSRNGVGGVGIGKINGIICPLVVSVFWVSLIAFDALAVCVIDRCFLDSIWICAVCDMESGSWF